DRADIVELLPSFPSLRTQAAKGVIVRQGEQHEQYDSGDDPEIIRSPERIRPKREDGSRFRRGQEIELHPSLKMDSKPDADVDQAYHGTPDAEVPSKIVAQRVRAIPDQIEGAEHQRKRDAAQTDVGRSDAHVGTEFLGAEQQPYRATRDQ